MATTGARLTSFTATVPPTSCVPPGPVARSTKGPEPWALSLGRGPAQFPSHGINRHAGGARNQMPRM